MEWPVVLEEISLEPVEDTPEELESELVNVFQEALVQQGIPAASIRSLVVQHTGPERWPRWVDGMVASRRRFRLIISERAENQAVYLLEFYEMDPGPSPLGITVQKVTGSLLNLHYRLRLPSELSEDEQRLELVKRITSRVFRSLPACTTICWSYQKAMLVLTLNFKVELTFRFLKRGPMVWLRPVRLSKYIENPIKLG